MLVLNVVRAGRRQEGYLERLIGNMYDNANVFFCRGYGICDLNPESIVASFYSVRNSCCKINPVKVHYMELIVDYDTGMEVVQTMADSLGRYFYERGFQSYITAIDSGRGYVVGVAVNSVSYKGPYLYHDNNAGLLELHQFLCTMAPAGCEVRITKNSVFLPDAPEGNYVHGVYI